MAERSDDLDIGHLFRVILMHGGQIALGTAIGAGVLLLVGIVGVLLSPILVPIFLIRYWLRERKKRTAAGQDITDLAPVHTTETPGVGMDVTAAATPGGEA